MAIEQGNAPGVPQEENLAALELVQRTAFKYGTLPTPEFLDFSIKLPGIFPVGADWEEALCAPFKIKTSYRETDCWYFARPADEAEEMRQEHRIPAMKGRDGRRAPLVPYEVVPDPMWTLAGKEMPFHRAVLILLGYRVPKGTQLVPTCGNHWCCNPGHREAVRGGRRVNLDRNWRLIRLPDGDSQVVYCLEEGQGCRAAGRGPSAIPLPHSPWYLPGPERDQWLSEALRPGAGPPKPAGDALLGSCRRSTGRIREGSARRSLGRKARPVSALRATS